MYEIYEPCLQSLRDVTEVRRKHSRGFIDPQHGRQDLLQYLPSKLNKNEFYALSPNYYQSKSNKYEQSECELLAN